MLGNKCWLVSALAVSALVAGCKPEEPIRSYTVEKEQAPTPKPQQSGGLSWTVPEGWTVGPPKQFRIVTLKKDAAEMYLSEPFQGSVLDNVNRWRVDPVGLPKIAEAELPSVASEYPIGAVKAHRVDFRGPGTGGGSVRFLGAIIPAGPPGSWFVRFSGPTERIAANEADFDKFLASIRIAK